MRHREVTPPHGLATRQVVLGFAFCTWSTDGLVRDYRVRAHFFSFFNFAMMRHNCPGGGSVVREDRGRKFRGSRMVC